MARTAQPAAAYARRAALRRWRADGLTVIAWTSVAVSLAIWLAHGATRKFTTVGSAITQLGIGTGLAATDLCLLMLLLAARIPIVDGAIGHDRALRAHRSLGAYTIVGLGLHGGLLTLGYALQDKLGVVSEFLALVGINDILLGVLGVAGLILVGLSSFAAARARLGHEAWWVIHLLTYSSVAASVPHQFSQGLLATNGLQRWYWMALYALTAFCLLAFRMFLPLVETFSQRLRVTRVVPVGPDAVSIEVRGRRVGALNVKAGQFFHWRFLGRGLWWHQHPFSVSAAPTDNTLRITVRDLGKGSAALQRVRVGTRVAIEGPYGLFSDAARGVTDGLVLMGAGIGIAPIRALLEETDVPRGRTTVILRASTRLELYLADEVTDLCRRRGATLYIAVGRRGSGSGNEQSWLPASWRGHSMATLAPQIARSDLFICGPRPWADAIVADAERNGLTPDRIHNERFSW